MKIIDVFAAALIGVIAVVFLMMTGDLGRTAALFPKILSVAIVGLVVIYIGVQISSNRKNRPLEFPGKESGAKKAPAGDVPTPNRWYIIIAAIGIYMGMMYAIGFGVASFVFGVALPYIGGYRRMRVVVPVSLGMTIGLVVIGRLFNIPLPAGLWATLL